MLEFAEQIRDNQYDHILNYNEDFKMQGIPVMDKNNDHHIIFCDEDFVTENFHNSTHIFIDATFKCRPLIKDCYQRMTILGTLSGRVSILYL